MDIDCVIDWMIRVSIIPSEIKNVPCDDKYFYKIAMMAIEKDPSVIRLIPFYANKYFLLANEALKSNPFFIRYISTESIHYKILAMAAIKENPLAIVEVPTLYSKYEELYNYALSFDDEVKYEVNRISGSVTTNAAIPVTEVKPGKKVFTKLFRAKGKN